MVLHLTKNNKVKHRNPVEIKIIIHEATIDKINNSENETLISLFNDLIINCFRDNKALKEAIDNKIVKIQSYYKIRSFWDEIIKKLPIVLVDGRIKTGDHPFLNYDNLYFRVRSSERYKDQVIEIIYDKVIKNS